MPSSAADRARARRRSRALHWWAAHVIVAAALMGAVLGIVRALSQQG